MCGCDAVLRISEKQHKLTLRRRRRLCAVSSMRPHETTRRNVKYVARNVDARLSAGEQGNS